MTQRATSLPATCAPAADEPPPALAALFERHHRLLVGFLTRMTRCPQRAEDLAQAAWLKLLLARERGACEGFSEPELRAYLFAVARNAFLDEYTRKHATVRTCSVDPSAFDGLAEPGDDSPEPEAAAERQQLSALVRAAVDDLPPEQRRVIRLWAQGTSIKDMAAVCAAPSDTVLSRKKYALARMRSRLESVPLR